MKGIEMNKPSSYYLKWLESPISEWPGVPEIPWLWTHSSIGPEGGERGSEPTSPDIFQASIVCHIGVHSQVLLLTEEDRDDETSKQVGYSGEFYSSTTIIIMSSSSSSSSSMSEKEKNKLIQEKCQSILNELLKDEDNKYCVDCDAKSE